MDMIHFKNPQTLPFANGSPPQLLLLAHVCNNPDWVFYHHAHDDRTEIIYVASGKAIYTLDRVPLFAKAGDLIVIDKGELHSIESDKLEPVDAWTCAITGLQMPSLPPGHLLPSGTYPLVPSGEDGAFFLAAMQAIYSQHRRFGATGLCELLTSALTALAFQLFSRTTGIMYGKNESFASQIIYFINEHYMEQITLQLLSDTFRISRSHISHEVRKVYGVSPVNYLINRRLSEAKWLLIISQDSIASIATKVGYDNADHFSNLFYQRVGMRPLEYREQFSKK